MGGPWSSRKSMVLGALAGVLLVIAVLAVKDLNDKLRVMTVSNVSYQRMADTQSERLKSMGEELRKAKMAHELDLGSSRRDVSDLKAKLADSEAKSASLRKELDKVGKDLETLRRSHQADIYQANEEHDRLQRANSDLRQARDTSEAELAEKLRQATNDKDRCQDQYLALFRLQQQCTDSTQSLQTRLRDLQFRCGQAAGEPQGPASKSTSPGSLASSHSGMALAMPEPAAAFQAPPPPPSPKSSSSTSSPAASQGVGRRVPQNLDNQVDDVDQDHPELPGPLDTGRLDKALARMEEENNADDAEDGRVLPLVKKASQLEEVDHGGGQHRAPLYMDGVGEDGAGDDGANANDNGVDDPLMFHRGQGKPVGKGFDPDQDSNDVFDDFGDDPQGNKGEVESNRVLPPLQRSKGLLPRAVPPLGGPRKNPVLPMPQLQPQLAPPVHQNYLRQELLADNNHYDFAGDGGRIDRRPRVQNQRQHANQVFSAVGAPPVYGKGLQFLPRLNMGLNDVNDVNDARQSGRYRLNHQFL